MTEGDFKDLLKEQILINHFVIKYFIMLKMQDMYINIHLLQWFTIVLDEKPATDKGRETGFNTVSDNQLLARELKTTFEMPF